MVELLLYKKLADTLLLEAGIAMPLLYLGRS